MFLRRSLLCTAIAVAAWPLHALAQAPAVVEVGGVKYATAASVGGTSLPLNGAGIRYKFVVKVYTAGLYLAGKATTPDAVLTGTGAKRMHVVMLRDIDANELGKLFTDGMQKNTSREEFGKAIPGTLKLAEIFAARKRLVAGDSFFIDYVPGTGTVISVNGKVTTEPIKEPEFFTALMRIWLGSSPADYQLKDALLGQAKG